MRIPGVRALAFFAGLLVVCCAPLRADAQPPTGREPGGDSVRAPGAEDAVKEVQPSVLLVKRKDGSLLQEVLGFTLEDFERFLSQRAQLGLGQQPPKFQVDRLVARGQAEPGRANLTVEMTVLTNDAGWVRVPLRLAEAVLRDKPLYQGGGEHRVEFDPVAKEHVLWLRGPTDKPHQLTLDVAVPVSKSAEQQELKLGFPRASVSELTLEVKEVNATANVAEGGILDETKHLDAGTRFKILGLERNFDFSWRPQNAEKSALPLPLESHAAILARVDGEEVHCDVTLTVRGFGARLDTFQLRVPAGVTLTADEQPEYSIEPAAESKAATDPQTATVFDVRLRERAAGPVVVHVTTEHSLVANGNERSLILTGVELVGTARQSGSITVQVVGDWQIAWDDLVGVRAVDELPGPASGTAGTFEFSGAPATLTGHVIPLANHLTVDAKYSVECDPQQIRLQARLKYDARGAKVFALEVALADWELDDLGPRTVFDVDRVVAEVGRPVRIPLLKPTTGEIELQLRAHRSLPADATRAEFTLPQPTANNVAPAQLEVTAAPNLSLVVREADTVGLTRIPAHAVAATTGDADLSALNFRTQGSNVRFVADMRVEAQSVAADVRSRVKFDEHGGHVEQVIQYEILNDPLSELSLDVPTTLASSGRIEWLLDGESVAAAGDQSEANAERTVRMRVPLHDRGLGNKQLVLHYLLDMQPLAAGTEAVITVPLVMPTSSVTSNEVSAIPNPGLKVQLRDKSWQAAAGTQIGSSVVPLVFVADQPNSQIVLFLERSDNADHDPLVLERTWIQTRLGGGQRVDRAVFLLTGGGNRVTLHLPAGAPASDSRLIVDGNSVEPPASEQPDLLDIEFPERRARHIVDVTYRLAGTEQVRGHISLAAPTLGDGLPAGETRWQLLLPRNEHLLDWPADEAALFHWRFQDGLLARQPDVEQTQLEEWVGAGPGAEVPLSTNRYVFAGLGNIERLDVRTASRGVLVLLGGGVMLAAGLLLMYFPALRQPGLLFAAAVVVAAMVVLFPDAAPLLAQFALLGIVLGISAALLSRNLRSRRGGSVVIRSGSSSILEPGSTRTHLRRQTPHSDSAPISLVPHAAAPEGEP